MKKTAVEWLQEQLECFGNKHELQVSWATVDELVEQAKAMHKEEIVEAYREGRTDQQSASDSFYNRNAESYYNETFGGGDE